MACQSLQLEKRFSVHLIPKGIPKQSRSSCNTLSLTLTPTLSTTSMHHLALPMELHQTPFFGFCRTCGLNTIFIMPTTTSLLDLKQFCLVTSCQHLSTLKSLLTPLLVHTKKIALTNSSNFPLILIRLSFPSSPTLELTPALIPMLCQAVNLSMAQAVSQLHYHLPSNLPLPCQVTKLRVEQYPLLSLQFHRDNPYPTNGLLCIVRCFLLC